MGWARPCGSGEWASSLGRLIGPIGALRHFRSCDFERAEQSASNDFGANVVCVCVAKLGWPR